MKAIMWNIRWRAALLTLAVAPYGAACDLIDYLGEGVQLSRTVEKLEIGTPEDQVLKRLGQPSDSGTKFYLGQEKGYETQYRAAAESPFPPISFLARRR